ncbi:MAG: hypothetical protein PHF86_09190 [Candidatus Nanoarchaeia archaeon]|nr:hypothetical protein [Candidatus Nanoarchaeia archaeon]
MDNGFKITAASITNINGKNITKVLKTKYAKAADKIENKIIKTEIKVAKLVAPFGVTLR